MLYTCKATKEAKMPEKKEKVIMIRITKADYEVIAKKAKAQDVYVSDYVRDAAREKAGIVKKSK